MEKYNIPGYPNLILFSGETKIKDYYENLNAESIIPWIRKIIYPTIQPINDELTYSWDLLQVDDIELEFDLNNKVDIVPMIIIGIVALFEACS